MFINMYRRIEIMYPNIIFGAILIRVKLNNEYELILYCFMMQYVHVT